MALGSGVGVLGVIGAKQWLYLDRCESTVGDSKLRAQT